ncbi:hypothetical protein RF11_10680 [Thelohanellus kitauei]|uniref:Uncharacterized protein n=1 Tax=Thelohanellus kitauei TaxID=669202 RepID=A0A0C2MPY9_THEKT|nr:hypothetical protein RF11_10680 [Thelohanellus kitauei]
MDDEHIRTRRSLLQPFYLLKENRCCIRHCTRKIASNQQYYEYLRRKASLSRSSKKWAARKLLETPEGETPNCIKFIMSIIGVNRGYLKSIAADLHRQTIVLRRNPIPQDVSAFGRNDSNTNTGRLTLRSIINDLHGLNNALERNEIPQRTNPFVRNDFDTYTIQVNRPFESHWTNYPPAHNEQFRSHLEGFELSGLNNRNPIMGYTQTQRLNNHPIFPLWDLPTASYIRSYQRQGRDIDIPQNLIPPHFSQENARSTIYRPNEEVVANNLNGNSTGSALQSNSNNVTLDNNGNSETANETQMTNGASPNIGEQPVGQNTNDILTNQPTTYSDGVPPILTIALKTPDPQL